MEAVNEAAHAAEAAAVFENVLELLDLPGRVLLELQEVIGVVDEVVPSLGRGRRDAAGRSGIRRSRGSSGFSSPVGLAGPAIP